MMNTISGKLKWFRKELLSHTPLASLFLYKYNFMFTPGQLCCLCDLLKQTKDVKGVIFEIGCAYGHTTVFLNKLLSEEKIDKRYLAVDTFSGFTEEDIQFEEEKRHKDSKTSFTAFRVNSESWFKKQMQLNHITRVEVFKKPIQEFDFSTVDDISFVLLDVDVYLPTKLALGKLWEKLSPGGIIVIDDCRPGGAWDGSLQAYNEFITEHKLPSEIMCDKLGVLRKPAVAQA